ncbi:hypothetical protein FEM08_00790 [Flavobacterium gilvum]|nr:DUF262 domain-containing protein [Flavobacterium gilvum]KFC61143.1 hypothetical protein FEM08_00790 [Flavobacterium gilvum]
MSEENKLYTFWSLLEEYEIIIPKIQRDYAQGRDDKKVEIIRNNILDDFEKILLGEKEQLNLDFVYGSNENDTIIPLDGQQRLTTLFLLHIYLVKISGNYDQKNKDIFKKFKYEIRSSTQKFINALIENEFATDIENQPWFFNSWKKDPTVKGMLVMLNAIHDKFKGEKELWIKLIGEQKITFYFLPLDKFKLTDELYVKMNSRGKPLSDFENFKSWLDEKLTQLNGFDNSDWSLKLDTTWTDLFWNNDNDDYSIDNEMMNFFRGIAMSNYVQKIEVSDENKNIFEKRIGELNDIDKVYLSNNEYGDILFNVGIQTDIFSDISKFLDTYSQKEETILGLLKEVNFWGDDNQNLFRKFIQNPTYSDRALFFGLFKYVLKHSDLTEDRTEAERFFRILRNLIENSEVNASTLKNILTSIAKMTEASDILTFMVNDNSLIGFNGNQVKEEQIKARLIDENFAWETKFKEAENHLLFRGNVGFLLNDQINDNQLENFKCLFERSKEIFAIDGISKKYKENSIFLRAFISQMDEWGQLWKITYDSEKETWSKILKNEYLRPLLTKIIKEDTQQYEKWIIEDSKITNINEVQKVVHENLYKSKLLNVAFKKCSLRWAYNRHILAPKGASAAHKVYILDSKRNKVLSQMINDKNNECSSEQKLGDIDIFWGWDIYFTYKKKEYIWNWRGEENEVRYGEASVTIENLSDLVSLKMKLDPPLELVHQ